MYVDHITRQTIDHATPIPCDNNPGNIIELDPDTDDQDFYILRPEPIVRKTLFMFTPNQIKTTKRPNTFTAQDAGIFSNAELDQFWNRIRFSKHSDTTLQLLGKALSFSFISSNTPDYCDIHISQTNPYNTLRIGLHDKLLNLTPLFTPSWFADAFITLFGYPCYILTQSGIYFSTFVFIQALQTLLIKLIKVYKTISFNYNLEQNIPTFSSIAHGFFNILTSDMINDLKDAPSKNRTLGPNKTSSKFSLSPITENPLDQTSINSDYPPDNLQLSPNRNNDPQNLNRITSPPPFYTKRPTRKLPKMLKPKFLPKRISYNTITIDNSKQVTQYMTHPSLPHYTNVTSKLDNTKMETPVKIYSKTNYSCPSSFNIGHSALFFT